MRPLHPLGRAVLFVVHLAALFALLTLALAAGTGCTHAHRASDGGGEKHSPHRPAEVFHCADCRLSRERCRCACWSGAVTPQDCTDSLPR